GEFVYIWGGPYDARDVISDVFGDLTSEEVIEAAIEAVQDDGIYDWAPHGNRRQPPDDEPPDEDLTESSADPRVLAVELLARIAELEEPLAELPPRPRGMGDNNPQEPIEAEPDIFDEADQRAVESAIAVMKAQPAEPAEPPAEAAKAATWLRVC